MNSRISDRKRMLSGDSQNNMFSNNSQETFEESNPEEIQDKYKPKFMAEKFDSKQYTKDKVEKYKEMTDNINKIKNLQN